MYSVRNLHRQKFTSAEIYIATNLQLQKFTASEIYIVRNLHRQKFTAIFLHVNIIICPTSPKVLAVWLNVGIPNFLGSKYWQNPKPVVCRLSRVIFVFEFLLRIQYSCNNLEFWCLAKSAPCCQSAPDSLALFPVLALFVLIPIFLARLHYNVLVLACPETSPMWFATSYWS